MAKAFPKNAFEKMFSRHCNKPEVFAELFPKSDPPDAMQINTLLIYNWNNSFFRFQHLTGT